MNKRQKIVTRIFNEETGKWERKIKTEESGKCGQYCVDDSNFYGESEQVRQLKGAEIPKEALKHMYQYVDGKEVTANRDVKLHKNMGVGELDYLRRQKERELEASIPERIRKAQEKAEAERLKKEYTNN